MLIYLYENLIRPRTNTHIIIFCSSTFVQLYFLPMFIKLIQC